MTAIKSVAFGDFCTYCGVPHTVASNVWPRQCANGHWMYSIVQTVAVPLVPIEMLGLVGVRRNIDPVGEVSLPGGYVDGPHSKLPRGESWQVGCARELFEESSETMTIDPNEVEEWIVRSTTLPSARLCLVFGISKPRSRAWYDDAVARFKPNSETQELVLIDKVVLGNHLAFPLHQEAAERWFKSVEHVQTQMNALG